MQFWGESKMPLDINGQGSISGITSLNTVVSDAELARLDGVTSAIQTQLNEKVTSEFVQTAINTVSINEQTASYTLVLLDSEKFIEMNVGSANNLTVPLNSSVAFPIGTSITILQTGSGQTTVVATGGVTINATPGLKLRTQWSSATLIKRNTNTWVLVGDLSA